MLSLGGNAASCMSVSTNSLEKAMCTTIVNCHWHTVKGTVDVYHGLDRTVSALRPFQKQNEVVFYVA